MPSALSAAVPAMLLATVVLLPFLDKAFNVDDPVFLRAAEHALVDPLHPTAFDYAWNEAPERLSTIVPTGPIGPWSLVPTILVGGQEWAAHLTMLLCLLAAILATVSLGLRLGLSAGPAAVAGLLLATSPVVLAMTATAMPDAVAMALGAAGLERLIAWRRDRRWHQAMASALLLGLAPAARSHLLLIIPVGAVLLIERPFSLDGWRRGGLMRFAPLVGALAVSAALFEVTRDPAAPSGSIRGALAGLTAAWRLLPNGVSYLIGWVSTTTVAVGWFAVRGRALLARSWIALVGALCAAVCLRLSEDEWGHYTAVAIAGVGLLVIADMAIDARTRRDHLQGILWLWMLVPMATGIYIHFAFKYLLAAAPGAALLIARRLPGTTRSAWMIAGAGPAALGTIFAVLLIRADAALAETGRHAAAKFIAPAVAAGQRVRFLGHWGFQWYAEKAGASFVTERPLPQSGELIVESAVSLPKAREPVPDYVELLDREAIPYVGIHLMDHADDAGFYSNIWGFLPCGWSDRPLDSFRVARVR